MYDLVADGIRDFYARRPGAQRLVRREPLSGLADGVNNIFTTPHPTWLVESLRVYVGRAVYTSADLAACDPDGGVIEFSVAPTVQPVADYTAVPLIRQQIVYYAWAGFDLLEIQWARGYVLSSTQPTYTPALYSDAAIYIGQLAGDSQIADPPIGATTFSQSHLQRLALAQCIDVAYLDSLLTESALADISYRERITGIALNSEMRPKNIKLARDTAFDRTRNAIYAAMSEAGDLDQFNAQTLPPHSADYESIWHWQVDSGAGFVTPGSLTWNLT